LLTPELHRHRSRSTTINIGVTKEKKIMMEVKGSPSSLPPNFFIFKIYNGDEKAKK